MSTDATVGVAVVGQAVVGDTALNADPNGTYLYTPPQWQNVAVMQRSLRVKIATSTTVYRQGGTWFNVLSPGMSNPDPRTCDIDTATGLLLYFNKPMVVPGTLYAELAAIQPANSAWSAGTLTQL